MGFIWELQVSLGDTECWKGDVANVKIHKFCSCACKHNQNDDIHENADVFRLVERAAVAQNCRMVKSVP